LRDVQRSCQRTLRDNLALLLARQHYLWGIEFKIFQDLTHTYLVQLWYPWPVSELWFLGWSFTGFD